MKYFLLVVTLTMAITCAMAQQDPLYSQYFNNPMLINPAFAGSNERLYSGLAYRAQWAGIEGGPATFNFNIASVRHGKRASPRRPLRAA